MSDWQSYSGPGKKRKRGRLLREISEMPDWEYRKYFEFIGGTPERGAGSLWRCCFCGKKVNASWA